jgi:16S rRNA (cytosine967-C5)-methyltransferase
MTSPLPAKRRTTASNRDGRVTPGARLEAVIELLEAIEESPRPADAIASAWFRARRFIGAKDRKAIHERVYGLLRRRSRIAWHLDRAGVHPTTRAQLLTELALVEHKLPEDLAPDFDGAGHHPETLTQDERSLIAKLGRSKLELAEMPDWVRLEYPEWLDGPFRALFGTRLEEEMRALLLPAKLDLRVNILKGTRDEAIRALALEGVEAEPASLSPWGLRLAERVNLMATQVFKSGRVEVQDEGSQLAAFLVGAKPGEAVCDFCAGAGGKTLALAAMMANKGRLLACDVSEGRLLRSAGRLKRAGVHNVQSRVVALEGDKWLKRAKGTFDRVLVDAPCTGTGTWRRNPDAKWKLSPNDLAELTVKQGTILERAARLVRPGGRLVYVTCSLLPDENERQIERFLAAHPDFSPKAPEPPLPAQGEYLRLSPARHGTDGFFAACLERTGPTLKE